MYMITIQLDGVFITLNVCSSQDQEVVSTVRRTVPASSTATSVVSAAMDKNKTWMLQPVEMATQKWSTLFDLQQIQVSCTRHSGLPSVEGGQSWGSWWRLHQTKDHRTSLASHESTGCGKPISSVDAQVWLCSFLYPSVVPLPVSLGFFFIQWLWKFHRISSAGR